MTDGAVSAVPLLKTERDMEKQPKVLALVAHDNMKRDLAEWVDWNSEKPEPSSPGVHGNYGQDG